ncbi:MAG: diaminopimelate decarboxylase [Campylobacteraceae bacterium]|nr:diaminopimelate decarboxylase [Campylobacteraceae bacterium]
MINFKELCKKYDTPLYVYDFNQITKNYNDLKDAFKARKSMICYAVKANSNLSILKHLANLGSGCDCVSIGEVDRALMAGISKYKIIFSGVGKKDDEIKKALQEEILMLNLESEEEMQRVEAIAKELNKNARISIRVNPNIDPKTHPYISTGLHENKFGVDIDSAKRMYLYANKSQNLTPVGMHYHIGSQIVETLPFKEAASVMGSLLKSLKSANINIKFFDIGGGIGIKYKDEKTISLYEYAQNIFEALSGEDVTIVCEPGRYMVGNCGYLLTKVLYEKANDKKRFVIVDAAMNDLIRPSLYQAYHDFELLDNRGGEKSLSDIVGPICESGDFLAKNVKIPKTKHDDLIVFKSVGAYGFTMSSNYNTRKKSAEVAIVDGDDKLIRKRESFENLIELEKDFI